MKIGITILSFSMLNNPSRLPMVSTPASLKVCNISVVPSVLLDCVIFTHTDRRRYRRPFNPWFASSTSIFRQILHLLPSPQIYTAPTLELAAISFGRWTVGCGTGLLQGRSSDLSVAATNHLRIVINPSTQTPKRSIVSEGVMRNSQLR